MKPFDEKLHEFISDITENDQLSECCGAPMAMGFCMDCREHCEPGEPDDYEPTKYFES